MATTAKARELLVRARTERWVRVLLGALEGVGMVDEDFYTGLRQDLIAAGATNREIDDLAATLVVGVVEATEPTSATRDEQFELIVDHLACTRMRITLRKDDAAVAVEFPDRPRIH
jgi:hypothetical protein